MDADQDDVFLAEGGAMGVYAVCTLFERDVRFFRNKELGIVAPVLKIQDYASCYFAVEEGFTELPVRGTFAGKDVFKVYSNPKKTIIICLLMR